MLPPAFHDFLLAHQTLFWWLAGTSVFIFIATLILVPILLVRLPTDYFAHGKRQRAAWRQHHPLIRAVLLVGKNIVGLLLLVTGVAMLFLPGQGLLTMVMALVLLDLPGKYRLERWLISRRPILRGVNWLRRRAHRPLIVLHGHEPNHGPASPSR